MIKKLLFLGLTFTLSLLGLFGSIEHEVKDEGTLVSQDTGKDDDEIKGRPDTGEGTFFLSISSLK